MSFNICIIWSFFICTSSFTCLAFPLLQKEDNDNQNTLSNNSLGIIVGLLSTVCLVLTVGLCVCCGKNKYFKWPRRHPRRVLRSNFGNGVGNGHEISIFPPPGIEQYLSASTSDIYFEPLPDITSHLDRSHPDRLSSSVASNLNEDWFAEPHKNFPRNQLQYLRKLGSGWFGQVLEGRAIGVDTDHTSTVITKGITSKSTPVVVKSLREDASQKEQAFFLQELIPYRDLEHKNILKIVAYCLETQPLLVLLQCCPKGDLKCFLKKEPSLNEVTLLKMAEDAAQGLQHMHEHNFIHTDLAARNCLVDEDLTVKIGDYGFSLQTYQDEYYLAENVALPLRWCAPETLHCTDTTIEARELTSTANVWSFGVLLWEIFSRGGLPYEELDEDGIIQKVILERSRILQVPPQAVEYYQAKMDEILSLCLENVDKRPQMSYICSLLSSLGQCMEERSEKDFEGRWNQLRREHFQQEHNVLVANNAVDLKFESDFSQEEKSSPTASLKNLHGSAEDLDARIAAKFGSAIPSWLGLEPGQTMDSFTEEISDAIQRLDEALSEDRSEPGTTDSSPEKGSVNFRLGKNSLVLNPPLAARTLSDGEEENLTMRLEQGDFSELVRLKSQSVQDFMRLTVVDDGSDSSDKTSQPNSFIGDFPSIHHNAQEKKNSSESNLKEAVRDAGFMIELEKLQAEHKFSIISEVSREGMSSIEDASRNSELFPKDCGGDDPTGNCNSFLGNDFPSSDVKGNKAVDEFILQRMEVNSEILALKDDSKVKSDDCLDSILSQKEEKKGETSPDCIVSSRDALPSAPLPDIIAHDSNINMTTSSDSSLDEDKPSHFQDSATLLLEMDSTVDNDSGKTSGIYSFDKEGSKDYDMEDSRDDSTEDSKEFTRCSKNVTENNKDIAENTQDDITDPITSDAVSSCLDKYSKRNIDPTVNSDYPYDYVVVGQDVIIGALDDYSLEIFKPAKTVDNFCLLPEVPSIENCTGDLNHNGRCLTTTQLTSSKEYSSLERLIPESLIPTQAVSQKSIIDNVDNFEKLESCKINMTDSGIADELNFLNTVVTNDTNDEINHVNRSTVYTNNNVTCSNVQESAQISDSFSYVKNFQEAEEVNGNKHSLEMENFATSSINENNMDFEENIPEDCKYMERIGGTTDSENQNCVSSQESRIEACTEPQDGENGEFWELQMAAWQEAAEQTRELLYEAVHPQDSEDDMLKSPESSHKSTYSSTDHLDDSDEEGTYVSYDMTDNDIVRYNSKDIDALRSELSLKLGDINEQPPTYLDVENENDMIFINYKSGCPSNLSPIKEEAIVDLEQYPSSDNSFEFAEFIHKEADELIGIQLEEPNVSKESFKISIPSHNNEVDNSYDLSAAEARDSLILEDLEENAPQPTVIGPLAIRGSSEDLIEVDTLTNKVTLIDSGRPQSQIAFLVEAEKSNEGAKFLPGEEAGGAKFMLMGSENFDDVDYESLPYEDTSSQFSSLVKSKETCVDDLPVVGNVDEEEAPHYQSYFTSAVSSISHPTPSLDGNDAFESAEHISLPYDVNLPVMKIPQEEVKPGQIFNEISNPSKRKFSSESEKEAVILDDPPAEGSFVTLSFLGRLYSDEAEACKEEEYKSVEDSQTSSMEHFYSTKSEEDSSDNEDIGEFLPEPEIEEHEEAPTPKRTPSHLVDFVWRQESDERYTPDWETDSDGNEDVESSSTSGEFVWQPGDPNSNPAMCMPAADKTSLEWQMANEKPEEEETATHIQTEEDEDSESGEEEFTPSTWNSELTPHRSLLKSPENSSGGKKSVHWKRQRHHRVYEYPPEPMSWHGEPTTSTPRRAWGNSHSLDYLTLADWEIGGDEFLDDNSEDFEFFPKGRPPVSAPQIYRLAPFAYDKTPEDLFSNSCEFFMGSPGSSYAFSRSSFTPAEFFPSRNSNTYDFYNEPNGKSEDAGGATHESYDAPDCKSLPEETKLSREKLRLDLPTLCLSEGQTSSGSERQNFSL